MAAIRELGELRQAGLLTDAEFAAEKARVLGG
ncbi:MAG: SHOCT domain-containing protein [Ornithinimicrobium sp.]